MVKWDLSWFSKMYGNQCMQDCLMVTRLLSQVKNWSLTVPANYLLKDCVRLSGYNLPCLKLIVYLIKTIISLRKALDLLEGIIKTRL